MLNRSAFRKSLWGGLSRVVGVGLGVGAGSALKQLTGSALDGWVPAILMALASLVLMVFAEYEKEITDLPGESLPTSPKARIKLNDEPADSGSLTLPEGYNGGTITIQNNVPVIITPAGTDVSIIERTINSP